MPTVVFSVTSDAILNFYNKLCHYGSDYYFQLFQKTVRITIQILNNLKSFIRLKDRAFKNWKKWSLPHKERDSNLDKWLSPYI